ncbi:NtaA/DmoA family FMN-dependent monooxygenase [Niallia taxi]|uniref:NtaA/DmoA family FMN-dependent monooxygenase n=1 Tax=Niallia taxi TaxID=2499688 RepID=UPI0039828E6C
MKSSKKMLLASQNMNYGASRSAWRSNPYHYMNSDSLVNAAKWSEKGKFQFVFIADHPAVREDLTFHAPSATIDPIVITSQIIRETEKIGVVLTQSTTFNHPYNVARQLKALDVLSKGRIGWNAVTTNDPRIAANYGEEIADRKNRYEQANEFIQIVQALWGSWGESALKLDTEKGIFADGSQVKPINLQGKYVSSRGPLPIPPSRQGQPIIFQAGGGQEGLELAGMYASGVYSVASDIETGREHRTNLDRITQAVGRKADEVKMFMGLFVTVGNSYEDALNRRKEMLSSMADELPDKVYHLSSIVGVPITFSNLHQSLPEEIQSRLVPNPYQLHSKRAVELLKKGLTVYDVLAHGVTDFHHTVLGSPEQIADEMQEIFEAGACDGFGIVVDRTHDGLPAFVQKVIPILQKRGLFHEDYEGSTLRDHLGVPYQYGRINL